MDYKLWSNEEVERLIELSKTHNVPELAKIFNKTNYSISNKLSKLGLKAVNKRNYWSEEDLEFLKANYNTMDKKELAKKLNRSYGVVLNKGRKLGVATKVDNIPDKWTTEDIDYLKRWYGIKTMKLMSKTLNRTPTAIELKAKRLKLGGKKDKRISTATIMDILGVTDRDKIRQWRFKGLLNMQRIPDSHMLYINLPELIKFMEENQDLWDTRLANYSFVFKRKPTWLIAKEESDKLKPLPKKTPKNELTISDVKKIKELHAQGINPYQIRKMTGFGKGTIEKYTTESYSVDGPFTREETMFVKENMDKLTVKEIAEHLDRAPSSIRGKIKRIKEEEAGIKKIKQRLWTEKEITILQKNIDKSIPELQKLLKKRSRSSIARKRLELKGYFTELYARNSN